jgi:hypothetical protein
VYENPESLIHTAGMVVLRKITSHATTKIFMIAERAMSYLDDIVCDEYKNSKAWEDEKECPTSAVGACTCTLSHFSFPLFNMLFVSKSLFSVWLILEVFTEPVKIVYTLQHTWYKLT